MDLWRDVVCGNFVYYGMWCFILYVLMMNESEKRVIFKEMKGLSYRLGKR